jgi:hypothetical protein
VKRIALTTTAAFVLSPACMASIPRDHGSRLLSIVSPQRITKLRNDVWVCQRKLLLGLTPAQHTQRELASAGTAYRAWIVQRWLEIGRQCQRQLTRRMIPMTNDWVTAVRLVQRVWPGTESWLLACSSSEGGHGVFVLNHGGSGAGGQMQFLHSTYESNSSRAFGEARGKGFVIPEASDSWYSPLGQAVTAGWMRAHGYDRGQWYGARC